MDTKLKSSAKQEVGLLAAWIFLGIVLSVTKGFFESLEGLHGNWYVYAKVTVVVLACLLLLIGIPVAVSTFRYVMAAWGNRQNRRMALDKIPLEILFAVTASLGFFWSLERLYYGGLYLPWFIDKDPDGHAIYDVFRAVANEVIQQFILLTVLGVAVWLLLRQIMYGFWEETSLLVKGYRRYCFSSSLGRKLNRIRWIFWFCVLIVFAAVGMTILFIDNSDYDMAVLALAAAGIAELILIFYQHISGVAAKDLVSLVEQIGAVSRAEPLDAVYQVLPNSLFYEPFRQLEELEEAVKKSAQKQLQAERLKIDLITNVSHDLKTPLTSMVGYVDLLKQEELSREAKDYIDVISQKQELLKEMIQNLFELSKSTSGVEELHMETLDMRKLFEQIMGDMENAIQESGMTVRTTFDDPPLLFSGDNEKMYRVVQNLLENALKYSLENTRIYVDAKRRGEKLLLQMKNISKYEMDFDAEEITGRFVRGDRSRTTEGHGLGLAIASSFTENMGGTLGVEVDGDLFKVTVAFPAVE